MNSGIYRIKSIFICSPTEFKGYNTKLSLLYVRNSNIMPPGFARNFLPGTPKKNPRAKNARGFDLHSNHESGLSGSQIVERFDSGIAGFGTEFLFDADQLIVLGDPVGTVH